LSILDYIDDHPRPPLHVGDLIYVEYETGAQETGIVVEAPVVSHNSGLKYVGVLMADEDTRVTKTRISRCHLISRSLGSPYHVTPFPDELTQGNGPQVTKFSSESFRELSTLTIDEDAY